MTPEMHQTMRSIQESVAATIRSSMAPQLADINATTERVSADVIKNAGVDEVARRIAAQLVNREVMEKISRGWATALSDSIALKAETLADIRERVSA